MNQHHESHMDAITYTVVEGECIDEELEQKTEAAIYDDVIEELEIGEIDDNASDATLDIDLSSESEDSSDDDLPDESFEKNLIVWGLKSNVAQKHMTKLLQILNRHLPNATIPTTYKLLLKQSRKPENKALKNTSFDQNDFKFDNYSMLKPEIDAHQNDNFSSMNDELSSNGNIIVLHTFY